MADDLDVDALLEEPYNHKQQNLNAEENGQKASSKSPPSKSRSRSRESRHRSRDGGDKSRSRSRDRDRRRRRHSKERKSRHKSRSKSRERRHQGRHNRDRERRRSGDRTRRRSRSRDRRRRSSRSKSRERPRHERDRSPKPHTEEPVTPEDRDARTIFVMQLSQKCRARDLEEFFSSVGKIKDIRLIICNKTRRFKGIAYIEFKTVESVPLALGLNGQKLLGFPIVVQPSQAEKNRLAQDRQVNRNDKGPMKLYVGSLHFNINEEMLKSIFEPFGDIQSIQLMMDPDTGRSKGFGFITYYEAADAKKALEQMNGFELAGRAIKVGHVNERYEQGNYHLANLDQEEFNRSGVDLGATGRLALMAKLAEGTGMKLPEAASQALSQSAMQMGGSGMSNVATGTGHTFLQHHIQQQQQQQQQLASLNPPIATQCFMLSNMFDPTTEGSQNWEAEIRDDVIDECNKHGGLCHIFVDKISPQGNVYVKCPSIAAAVAAVNALHGRWFAGRVIKAAYVPLVNYHNLFQESIMSNTLLTTRR